MRPDQPFKWTSGWNSPIYCDNRLILSHPQVRTKICNFWAEAIKNRFSSIDAVAGVATAGIAWAAILADVLDLPMAYIRSKPKEHGTEKLIEGRLEPDWNVLVIEDLISTGKSSLQAIKGIQSEDIEVKGLMGIFSYQFPIAEKAFESAGLEMITLCSYPILVEEAEKLGYITEEHIPVLQEWRKAPDRWKQ